MRPAPAATLLSHPLVERQQVPLEVQRREVERRHRESVVVEPHRDAAPAGYSRASSTTRTTVRGAGDPTAGRSRPSSSRRSAWLLAM